MKSFVIILVSLVTVGSALNWQETAAIPGVQTIEDLVPAPGGILFAAANSSDSGYIYKSLDGFNWERCGPMPGYVRHVYCLLLGQGDTLWAGTRATLSDADSGRLYLSSDGGSTWLHRSSVAGLVTGLKITALLEDDSGYIYAGHDYFDGSSAYPPCVSRDRGLTWTQAGAITPYCAYQYIIMQASDGTVYCGTWGWRGLVMKSANRGATWSATAELFDAGDTPSLIEVPGGTLFACTYPKIMPQQPYGRVFKSSNGGTTWTETGNGYFNSTEGLRGLIRTSDSTLFVGSEPNGEVFASADQGSTWTSTGTTPSGNVIYRFLEVARGDTTFLYAATGNSGFVCRAVLSGTGVSEEREPLAVTRRPPTAGIVRGVLEISPQLAANSSRPGIRLLDISGRKVLDLHPGANDVSRLAPGVYFLRSADGRRPTSKVVIQR
jgi:hypothetical protein